MWIETNSYKSVLDAKKGGMMELPPKLDPNCSCRCHWQPGLLHSVACCHLPPAELSSPLGAAAMRPYVKGEVMP